MKYAGMLVVGLMVCGGSKGATQAGGYKRYCLVENLALLYQRSMSADSIYENSQKMSAQCAFEGSDDITLNAHAQSGLPLWLVGTFLAKSISMNCLKEKVSAEEEQHAERALRLWSDLARLFPKNLYGNWSVLISVPLFKKLVKEYQVSSDSIPASSGLHNSPKALS